MLTSTIIVTAMQSTGSAQTGRAYHFSVGRDITELVEAKRVSPFLSPWL